MCGEKRRAGSGRAGRIGSLPRVRGEVHDDRWRNGNERITPACAGRSNCILRLNAICEDHPRVRGEKSSVRVKNRSKSGSPPRVRGEAEKVENCRYDGGITPACAGRSENVVPPGLPQQDHPRVCGEKTIPGINTEVEAGSPPRVRGEVRNGGDHIMKLRITPACAGRRARLSAICTCFRDHPRVCGEKHCKADVFHVCSGSPPRVRGEACGRWARPAFSRITPACAGRSHC